MDYTKHKSHASMKGKPPAVSSPTPYAHSIYGIDLVTATGFPPHRYMQNMFLHSISITSSRKIEIGVKLTSIPNWKTMWNRCQSNNRRKSCKLKEIKFILFSLYRHCSLKHIQSLFTLNQSRNKPIYADGFKHTK